MKFVIFWRESSGDGDGGDDDGGGCDGDDGDGCGE